MNYIEQLKEKLEDMDIKIVNIFKGEKWNSFSENDRAKAILDVLISIENNDFIILEDID